MLADSTQLKKLEKFISEDSILPEKL